MSDSNPLFAMLFKLLGPILPATFQYFGLWIVVCFVLQSICSFLIVTRLTRHREQALFATLLFIFLPTFLGRIAYHLTLSGQWELLAAILIYMSPEARSRTVWWISLIVIGVLTTPYLLLMTGTVWLADVLRAIRVRPTNQGEIYLRAGIVLVSGIAAALLSGVYAFSPSTSAPFSQLLSSAMQDPPVTYRFNLASPFDSAGWSYFLPRRAHPEAGEYEGLSFVGAGWLLLLTCAAALAVRNPRSIRVGSEHRPLVFLVLGLLIFAASPFVSIGERTIIIPWPTVLYWLGSAFRATGRFVWPALYLIIIYVLLILARNLRRRILTPLLVVAVVLQVADTRSGWGRLSPTFAEVGSKWPSPMKSPLWQRWAKQYRAIRWATPTRHYSPADRDLSYFALESGLGTDAVYLARVNAEGFAKLSTESERSRRTGLFGKDALWILDKPTYQLVRTRSAREGDFIGEVDGFLVLAPAQSNRVGP